MKLFKPPHSCKRKRPLRAFCLLQFHWKIRYVSYLIHATSQLIGLSTIEQNEYSNVFWNIFDNSFRYFINLCRNQDLGRSDWKNSIVALFYAHPTIHKKNKFFLNLPLSVFWVAFQLKAINPFQGWVLRTLSSCR